MNYFEILNIKEIATLEEIKVAYNVLVNNKEIKKNLILLESIKKSYEVLSKENLKKVYLQKLVNLKIVKKDLINTKIKYIIKNGQEINELILSQEYIEFNSKRIRLNDIDFINTNIVRQKSELLKSGDRYFIHIGTKNKKITIIIDNKLNIGNDILFEDILSISLLFYRKNIVKKIKNKLTDKKHYNITEQLELTPKGVVIIQNNTNTVIPIENIEFITTYDTLVIKNIKKNNEYVFDTKDNLNNHMIVPFIYKDESFDEIESIDDDDANDVNNIDKLDLTKDTEDFLAESLIIKKHKENVYLTIGKNLGHIKELMDKSASKYQLELYNKYVLNEEKKYVDLMMFVKLYKEKLRSYLKKKEEEIKQQEIEEQYYKESQKKSLKQNIIIICFAIILMGLYLILTNRI